MAITKDIIEAEFRTTGGSKVQKDMNEVQKNIALINNENEKLRVTKAKLEAQNKKGSQEWKNVNARIKENNKQLTANKGNLKVLQSQLKVTDMTTKQLKNNIFRLNKELDETSKSTHPDRWNRLNKELKESNAQMTKLKGRANTTGKSMGSLQGIASTFLPVVGVAGFVSVLKSAGTELFALTKQMQGDAVRSSVVFGDQMGYVEEQAAKLADQMGLTNREFVAASAATADLLIPLGFTREESAKMSTELQGLSGALDEWTAGQHGAAGVSEILTKAMLGENEQLKQLGISIQMDSKEFKDLVKVKQEATGATTAQAKAMATLELINLKSADAQAAYNQEGNKLLRLQKQTNLMWKNMKESIVEWMSVSPVEELQNEQAEVNKLVVQLNSANVSEETRAKLLERLNTLAPEVAAAIQNEQSDVNDLSAALEEYNSQMALRILMKEQELKIDDQKSKQATYLQLTAEHEAKMVKAMNESLSWFQDKGPQYMDMVNEVLYDSKKTTYEKAQQLNSLALEATVLGNKRLFQTMDDYRIFKSRYAEESNALDKMVADAEALKNKFSQIFGTDPSASPQAETPTTTTTTTATEPTTPDKVKLPTIRISEDDIEKEMAKLQDKEIEEYLKGVDRLRAIQEQYGLGSTATVNEQALAQIRKLRDDKIITEQEYIDAKKAILDDDLQQQIDRNLRYRMMQQDNRLLDLEQEQLTYQERLAQEEIQYQEALDLENERNAIEVERAKGQKDLLLELEIEHKEKLIGVENTYTQRKADVINRQNAIEKGRLQIASAVADGIATVLGEETALGKAALIAKQGLALAAATIDLTRGLSATAAVGFPQNVPLITAFLGQTAGFISTIKNATASTNDIGSRQEGGFAETGFSDSEAKGIYHANEFIGNADSVRNPSVKQAYDIIDIAQKNGSINTLDLSKALGAALPGRQSGGFANDNASAPATVNMPSELMDVLVQNTLVMQKIQEEGVLGRWEWQTYKDGKQKMEDLEQDVGLS